MRPPLARCTYGDEDAAATLVLLHGVTDSGACWDDAARRWVAQGFRVVAVDARGHGRSERWTVQELQPGGGPAPGDVMADDVLRLLESDPGGAPVVLVGHSMGAAVAVAAAARVAGAAGTRVRAVVAEDPPWPLPPRTAPDPEQAARFLAGWEQDHGQTVAQRVEAMAAEHPRWPPSEVTACAVARDLCQREFLAVGDITPRTPWPDLVSAVTANGVPLLVVSGDVDVRITNDSAFVAERRGAQVVRVPGAGHCVRRDAADGYHGVVDAFLARVTGASGG